MKFIISFTFVGNKKEERAFFNKNVVENVEVGNGDKESTYRSRKASVRADFCRQMPSC